MGGTTGLGLVVSSNIGMLSPEERESIGTEDRRAEVFLLHSMGWTQTRIAQYFGVTQATISKDLGIEQQRRHSRAQNIEQELGRIAGVIERVMEKAWARHDEAFANNPNGVAASNYLKLVLDGAEKYAHILGLDVPVQKGNSPQGKTRVVIQLGGSGEKPSITMGVESPGEMEVEAIEAAS